MSFGPPYFETNDLAWVFESPGLLNESCFGSRIVGDRDLTKEALRLAERLDELRRHPTPLLDNLATRATHGRLGRYFESLLHYYLSHLRNVQTLHSNIQVREHTKRTLGEFDFVFEDPGASFAEHWEASVKFYICTTTDREEARQTPFYMGTLVHDRLDRKINKFFEAQLRLAETVAGKETLERMGFSLVRPRALLKGYLYYPAEIDWRHHPSPPEISPSHERGWWLTADRLEALPTSVDAHYVVLPFARWLSRLNGWLTGDLLLTHSELTARVRRLFDSSWARPVNYEMMVAEVEIIESAENAVHVRERSRGNILHSGWPRHARQSIKSFANFSSLP